MPTEFTLNDPGDDLREVTITLTARQVSLLSRALVQAAFPALINNLSSEDRAECSSLANAFSRQAATTFYSGLE